MSRVYSFLCWFLAAHRGPVQFATVALIVIVSLVNAETVIPQHKHGRLPAEPAAENGLCQMFGQIAQERSRFFRCHSFDADAIGWIDIQGLLASHGMSAHNRVG